MQPHGMPRSGRLGAIVIGFVLTAALFAIGLSGTVRYDVDPQRVGDPDPAALRSVALRIPFVEGSPDSPAAFVARAGSGVAIVDRDARIHYGIPRQQGAGASTLAVSEQFAGATAVAPAGNVRSSVSVSRFIGSDSSQWQPHAATYETLSLGEPWDGVRVELAMGADGVEKVFVLERGADVSSIRVAVEGVDGLAVDDDGRLLLEAGATDVWMSPPVAFQDVNGERRPVEVAYAVSGNEYGFELGAHDPAYPVTIDPILRSTYFGGASWESPPSILVHPVSGEVYVSTVSCYADIPGLAGGYQSEPAAPCDWLLARLNADLTQVIQATYIGGNGAESAPTMEWHPQTGELIVAGPTESTDFPGTAGGAQPALAGGPDLAVARLGASLTTLAQASYLGAPASGERLGGLAIHPASGDIYLSGTTTSANFPGIAGGLQYYSQYNTIFVSRLSSDLTTLYQSSLLAGSSGNTGNGVLIAPQTGDIYVFGNTGSTDFPGTAGGAQPTNPSTTTTMVVARLDAGLTQLANATYFGGLSIDLIGAAAMDPVSGDILVAGHTCSNGVPGTTGGLQPARSPGPGSACYDMLVGRFDASLGVLRQATYFGGQGGDDWATDVLIDTNGDVIVAGQTFSTNLAGTAGGLQPRQGSFIHDYLLVRMRGDLRQLVQATYLGGQGREETPAIAPSLDGLSLYIAGVTQSIEFPITAGALQSNIVSASDGAVTKDLAIARVSADLRADTTIDPIAFGSVTDAPLDTWIESAEQTITGIDSLTRIDLYYYNQAEYQINGGAWTTWPAWLVSGDVVRARVKSNANHGTTESATLFISGINHVFSVTTYVQDGAPDPFGFPPATGVEPSSTQQSATITPSGFNISVPVRVWSGTYSKNGGPFTAEPGTAVPGDTFRVQHTASGAFSASVTTRLTLGSVYGEFTSTTRQPDITPHAFFFADVTDVVPGTEQTSNAIVISGIEADSPVSVANGQYSINGGVFTSVPGVVRNGDSVRVRHYAPFAGNASTDTTLTVGANGVLPGVSDSFTSTTAGLDTLPDACDFSSLTDVPRSSLQHSDVKALTGYNVPIDLSISNGEYSLDGGSFTNSPGQMYPGQSVQLRQLASARFGTTVTTVLQAGDRTCSFAVSTLEEDLTPDPFAFPPVTDAALGSLQYSATILIAGINSTAAVSVEGGEVSVADGAYTSAMTTIQEGQTLRVRHVASSEFSTTQVTTVHVGTAVAEFRSTTLAKDTTPDAFDFIDQAGVLPRATVTSNTVTVTGINHPAPISISNGEYRIGSGAWTTAPGTVGLGETVTLRHRATVMPGGSRQTQVTIGGVPDTFSSTTLGP